MQKTDLNLDALELLRSGVYIVTSAYRNQPAGCTCVWVSRVSFAPPLMAVCLDPGRHTLQAIEQGKRFCINILGESGLDLARRFGFTSGHETRKFAEVEYVKSKHGSPILKQAITYIDCNLVDSIPVGDHKLVTGEIVETARVSDEDPLVYNPRTFYGDAQQHQFA